MNKKINNISFGDQLLRLFPQSENKIGICGNHTYNITLQVTENCNLRCSYCYEHNKSLKSMSFETGKKFIDLILASDERSSKYIKSKETQGVTLDFIGGEPLLEIDLIDKLTDYFITQLIELNHPWTNRYRISICTNGMLYFDEKVQNYIKKNKNHLSLSITIDGDKTQHDACRVDEYGNGSYDIAKAAADDYYEKYGEKVGSKITIAPQNVMLTSRALKHFIDNKEYEINANCVYEEGWNINHAIVLYHELKDVANYLLSNNLENDYWISILDWFAGEKSNSDNTWCGGSGLMICLDPSGDIYPCLRYAPCSIGTNQPLLKIGDVENGFVYNDEQQSLIDKFSCVTRCSQFEKTEHCKDCPISQGCGDCAAYSYEIYGEVGRRTTFHCDMHKARVLAQVYYKNKRAIKNNDFSDILDMNCPKDWAIQIIGEDEYNMLCKLVEERRDLQNVNNNPSEVYRA